MHAKRIAGGVLLGLVWLCFVAAPAQELGYQDYTALSNAVRQLAKSYPNLVSLQSAGRSPEGRDLWLLEITDQNSGQAKSKPAVFVVGNLEGNHVVGSELALGVAKELVEGYATSDSIRRLLQKRTFYVLPRANPEGAEFLFGKTRWEHPENTIPWDDDFDDIADEDGPEDLNGDGWISQMRVRDPEGEYCVDPEEPRLMKKIDRAKGETGEYKIYTEGIDNDGDEQYNEDGPGGVSPDRNFPHTYPYNKQGAGRYQLQAPEAKAIADFLLEHRNVAAVLTFCLHDNLLSPPKAKAQRAGQPDRSQFMVGGRMVIPRSVDRSQLRRMFERKAVTSVNEKDVPYYTHVSEEYKRLLGVKGETLVKTEKPEGAFFEWAYFQYGVPSFATVGWFPVLEAEKKAEKDTTKGGEQRKERKERLMRRRVLGPGPFGMKSKTLGQKKAEDAQRQWLKWIEKNRGGEGFLEWIPFEHSQLGEVEIGGFLPYVKTNPPVSQLPDLIKGHARFVGKLAQWLPEVEIAEAKVEPLGGDVYRVKVVVANGGYFPTLLAHAERGRAVKPTRVEVHTDAEILSGRKITFLRSIPGSGGREQSEWILKGRKGTDVELKVVAEKAGTVATQLTLE